MRKPIVVASEMHAVGQRLRGHASCRRSLKLPQRSKCEGRHVTPPAHLLLGEQGMTKGTVRTKVESKLLGGFGAACQRVGNTQRCTRIDDLSLKRKRNYSSTSRMYSQRMQTERDRAAGSR